MGDDPDDFPDQSRLQSHGLKSGIIWRVCGLDLEVPIFKKSFQKLPSHIYIFWYTWKTTEYQVLSHFDNF